MGFEAVELYHKTPHNFRDEASDICVLNACSHSALLSEARSIFNGISHKTEKVITTMVCLFAKLIEFLLCNMNIFFRLDRLFKSSFPI